MDIVLTIPEASITKARTGYFKLYPNIEKDEEGVALYTDLGWFKEKLRRIIIRDIHRGLQMIQNESAVVEKDDTIVS